MALSLHLIRKNRLVYGLLAAAWVVMAVWQLAEHDRVKRTARRALINGSHYITTTLGVVIRSQRRFGGFVHRDRLEAALKELVKSGEMRSVALVNGSGEFVASAGPQISVDPASMSQQREHWEGNRVIVLNLVDLGANLSREDQRDMPTVVITNVTEIPRPPNLPRPHRGERSNPPNQGSTPSGPTRGQEEGHSFLGPPPRLPGNGEQRRRPPRWRRDWGRMFLEGMRHDPRYKALLKKRGVHGLLMAFSTTSYQEVCQTDLWMRWGILGLSSIVVFSLGLAWRNVVKSSELQMRLIRASELNAHLREMNLAAAGLAHETRNPLNIIRGLAQMITKQRDTAAEVRDRSQEIIDETDRVTGQLNEFINYSRPREVRLGTVPLTSAVAEVVRALTYDLEEKSIQLQVGEDMPVIRADEQLLRQALFNLLLNAIQAVAPQGKIEVSAARGELNEASLEIRDNGPGVPPDQRQQIFKPYFTSHQRGTGLGLAVVQQIVLAHGWEIECLANEPQGAWFRITHLRIVSALAPTHAV